MSSDINSAVSSVTATPAVTGATSAANAPALPLPGARPAAEPAPAALPEHRAPAAPDVVQQAAQRVVEAMQNGGNSFQFSIDKQSGMTIVKVFNRATGELVRQIPSEEIVHIAQLLRQDEQRPLLDIKV